MNEIKIHDIKPLVEVPDYSFYFFYGLILVACVIFTLLAYYLYKYLKNKKQNVRKEYYKSLKNNNFTNSKKSAYDITKYGTLLARSDREKQLLNDLVSKLEEYKYKKDVPNFDDETKALYDNFLNSLDV